MTHTSLARNRRGDAGIGWRPIPEKILTRCPAGAKKPVEKPHHGPGTRHTNEHSVPPTYVRRNRASWSLDWPSEANLLARMQLKRILYPFCAPVTFVYLPCFVFGRLLSRLDYTICRRLVVQYLPSINEYPNYQQASPPSS